MNVSKKYGDTDIRMRSVTLMRIAKIGYIVMSVFFCIAGILFIARPDIGTQVLSVTLGIALTVFGAVKIVGYFSKDLFRLAFQFDLELGIICIVLGIIVLLNPFGTATFILIAMGIVILADALFRIRVAVDAKRFGIASWWVILSFAFLAATTGVLLVFRPWESASVLTVLLGISLLAEGVMNLCVAVGTVKIIRHQYPDFIMEEEIGVRFVPDETEGEEQ